MEISVAYVHNLDSDTVRSMHVEQQFSKIIYFAKRSSVAYKFIMVELNLIAFVIHLQRWD
jgi:hypothetical protein